jgi:hypothetical protein
VDARIQAYLRGAAACGRETERIGPFLATFDSASGNPFLNYAIPDDGAQPSAAEVQALTEAYARRGLRPGLEYLPSTAPGLEDALRAGGFEAAYRS